MPVFQLQTSDRRKFNSKLHIPYAEPQVVEFDAEGKFEATLAGVDELQSLLGEVPDFSVLTVSTEGNLEEGDTLEPQTDENELGKSEDEGNDIGKPDENDDALLQSLDGLRMIDMKQVAEDSGFPKEQWETLNKPDLKNYLKEKLKAAA